MEGIDEVRQLDETHLHWVASIAGVRREWDATITQQIPDQLIAWTSSEGTRNDGLVTFEALAAHRTLVSLRMDLEPEGAVETIGDATGLVQARTRGDLRRFKEFIESRRLPTGAWRGEVVDGAVDDTPPAGDRSGAGVATGTGASNGTGHRVAPSGEVPASTGGVVDLDRIVGTIPVLLVFVEPLHGAATATVLESLGQHLSEFGRDRIQLLAVARVDQDEAVRATSSLQGNVRVLADPDGELARRHGVEYLPARPVTVLVGADGVAEAVWVDIADAELAVDLRRRVGQLSAR
jgi:peroxiredoxin